MRAWCCFFSLLHLCFAGGQLGGMHHLGLTAFAVDSLNAAIFRVCQVESEEVYFDAEEQLIITCLFYPMLRSVLHKLYSEIFHL